MKRIKNMQQWNFLILYSNGFLSLFWPCNFSLYIVFRHWTLLTSISTTNASLIDPDEVDEPTTKSTKRRRKVVTTTTRENGADVESNVTTAGLVERKRLLLAPAVSKRRSMFLRQIASGKTHLKNKSLVRTIGKVHSNLYTNITYLLSSFLQKLLNVFFLCSFCNSDMA